MRNMLSKFSWCLILCTVVNNLSFAEIVLKAVKMDKPPVIDGSIEDIWEKACKVEKFSLIKTLLNPKITTKAYIGFDDDNLYVAFKCDEPEMGNIVANVKEHDNDISFDDWVEVFLDMSLDKTNYLHFAINTIGTTLDEKGSEVGKIGGIPLDRNWNPVWEAKVLKANNFWSVEMKLPLKELNPGINSSKEWGINLCRRRPKRGKGKEELSNIVPVLKRFDTPSKFLKLQIDFNHLKYMEADFIAQRQNIIKDSYRLSSDIVSSQVDFKYAREVLDRAKLMRENTEKLYEKVSNAEYNKEGRDSFVNEFKMIGYEYEEFKKDALRIDYIKQMVKAYGVYKCKFAVAIVDSCKRVFLNDNMLPFISKNAKVSLAKNEYEGFQLILIPLWQDVTDVEITTSDLKGKEMDIISKENIEISPVGYVKTKASPLETNYFGWTPDILLKNEKFVLRNNLQPVWINIYAPPDAKSGQYNGEINILGTDKIVLKLKLTVDVYDFTLPAKGKAKTAFYLNLESFKKYYGENPTKDVLQQYYNMLLKHKLYPIEEKFSNTEKGFLEMCKSKKINLMKLGEAGSPVLDVNSKHYPGFMLDNQLISSRIMFWMIWKENLPNYLFYNLNQWGDNTSKREKFKITYGHLFGRWNTYSNKDYNGDGMVLYPGPFSSIRLENIRDGIEDYEYLALLKDKITQEKGKISSDILQKAEECLKVRENTVKSFTNYTEDLNVIYQEREKIAKLIESLSN